MNRTLVQGGIQTLQQDNFATAEDTGAEAEHRGEWASEWWNGNRVFNTCQESSFMMQLHICTASSLTIHLSFPAGVGHLKETL